MSTGSEFKSGNSQIIFGGGEPLPGAPPSWELAKAWQEKANAESANEHMQWGWDCNFKLDYDGEITRISSRFYPPAKYYGPKWDGSVDVYIFDKKVHSREFKCDSLDHLKSEVEAYVSGLSNRIYELLQPLKNI